jgi:hypothetical protein
MYRALYILLISLLLLSACAPTRPAIPVEKTPYTPPSTPAPVETVPVTEEGIAASFNLPYVSVFSVQPFYTIANYPAVIKWDVKNAVDVVIEPNIGIVQAAGTKDFTTPMGTTTYKLTATNAQGSVVATTTLTIAGALPGRDIPVIKQFTAGPHIIKKGESSTLTWKTIAASSVTLNGTTVQAEGSMQVSPTETKTYNLVATNTDGTQYQAVTINVK